MVVNPYTYRGSDLALDILHGVRTLASQPLTTNGFPYGLRRLPTHRWIEP